MRVRCLVFLHSCNQRFIMHAKAKSLSSIPPRRRSPEYPVRPHVVNQFSHSLYMHLPGLTRLSKNHASPCPDDGPQVDDEGFRYKYLSPPPTCLPYDLPRVSMSPPKACSVNNLICERRAVLGIQRAPDLHKCCGKESTSRQIVCSFQEYFGKEGLYTNTSSCSYT